MKKTPLLCFMILTVQTLFSQATSFCTALRQLEKYAATNFAAITNKVDDTNKLHYSFSALRSNDEYFKTEFKLPGFAHYYIIKETEQAFVYNPYEFYFAVSPIRFTTPGDNSIAIKKIDALKTKIAECLPDYSVTKDTLARDHFMAFISDYCRYTFSKKNEPENSPQFVLQLRPEPKSKTDDGDILIFFIAGTIKEKSIWAEKIFDSSFISNLLSQADIEITKDDITKYPDITADKITVVGIRLGMKKEEVLKLVEKRNWEYTETIDQATSNIKYAVNDKIRILGEPTDIFQLTWNSMDEVQEIIFDKGITTYLKGEAQKLFSAEGGNPSSDLLKKFLGTDYHINNTVISFIKETEYDYYTKGIKIKKSQYRNYEPTITMIIYKK